MSIVGLRAAFAALAISVAGPVLAELQILELAIETTASAVVLPSQPPSTAVVTQCAGCKLLVLPTSTRSRYFIGQQPVELEELKRQLAGRPNAFVLIIYDRKTSELRRLHAALD